MAAITRNMGIASRMAFDAAIIGTLVIAFVGEGLMNTFSLLEK